MCSVKQIARETPAINNVAIRNADEKAAKYFNAESGIPLAGRLYNEHSITTRLKSRVRLVLFYAIKHQVPNLSTCVPPPLPKSHVRPF